jgi:hypothetical protein
VTGRAPAGWPRDLPPPGTGEFDDRVCGWLLDRGPADLRGTALRSMPIALARVVAHSVEASLTGMRAAYASARVELGEYLTPDEVATAQTAMEAEGARLLQVQREVRLVEEALQRNAGVRPPS